MADITVNFIHPTDGKRLTVTIDDTMTASEAIGQLLLNNFITSHPDGYQLSVKGGAIIPNNYTFNQAGVANGIDINIIPATNAG